jgi:putative hydrolase of the HAD superfamily
MNEIWILFDWGNTLMRELPGFVGPMADWPRVDAVSGAVETLSTLKEQYRIALATNAVDSGEDQIRAALARVGLGELVEGIFCYQSLMVKKPAPEFFTKILDQLGIQGEQAVMVGDSLENDVLGAVRAGLHAVWFNEASGQEDVGAGVDIIHSLPELVPMLEVIFEE